MKTTKLLVLFILPLFHSFLTQGQKVQRVILYSKYFSNSNSIDPLMFPDLVTKYNARIEQNHILLRLPNGFTGLFDFNLNLDYNGFEMYDSIRINSYVSMEDFNPKVNNECSYSTTRTIPSSPVPPGTLIEFRGSTSPGGAVIWGGGGSTVCKNCTGFNFNGLITQSVRISYDYWNLTTVSKTHEIDPRYSSYFIPDRPLFNFKDQPYQYYEYREHFCKLCATDLNRMPQDLDLYIDCLQNAITPSRNDIEVFSSIGLIEIVGYRQSSPLNIAKDDKIREKSSILKYFDLKGIELSQSQAEGNIVIVLYENGKRELQLVNN